MTWLALAYFYICAAFAVSGALAVALARNAIRAAMGLLLLILSLAGLFLSLRAQFLAVIQLIVYAGAVVILFLFVIMLLGPSADPPHDHRGRVTRGIGATVFGLSMFVSILPLTIAAHMHPIVPATADFGSIDSFGWWLYNEAIVPFELSSALLMVAVLGAVAVARGRQGEAAHTMPSSQPGLDSRGGTSTMILATEHYIALSAVLFALGGVGFFQRRNVLIQLMSIEVMLNAVNLALVTFNRTRPEAHTGQVFAFFIIAAEAAEVAVGLAIVLSLFRLRRTVRSDEADLLKH